MYDSFESSDTYVAYEIFIMIRKVIRFRATFSMAESLNPVSKSIKGQSETEMIKFEWEMGKNGRGRISLRCK